MEYRKNLTEEFYKTSFSGDGGCVEVAFRNGKVFVRDSKNQEGPILTFTVAEWENFIRGVKAHEFEIV
jgi:hypothetical protein